MTRLQKKCFLFSTGLHGLLLGILILSSAFRNEPVSKNIPILTMLPANIVEGDSAGGGSIGTPAPQQAQAIPQPVVQPAPKPAPTAVQTPPRLPPPRPVEPVERHRVREVERERPMKPTAEKESEIKPPRKTHEITPDFTPASSVKTNTKSKTSETALAQASARAEARRLRQIAESLDALARGVKRSGAQGTVLDLPGQGGGEAFAGYETVIYNAYYHAWITPDSVADRQAATAVKIVVARDGSILSAEIINRSGEPLLDRSVERALRSVSRLPPFPSGARDEQRTFLIRFNLDAKEGSG